MDEAPFTFVKAGIGVWWVSANPCARVLLGGQHDARREHRLDVRGRLLQVWGIAHNK